MSKGGPREGSLATAGQLDTFLEFLHRLIERQVATLQFVDQVFQVCQRLFEIDRFVLICRHSGIYSGFVCYI